MSLSPFGTEPHQRLVEAGWSPVVGCGVEGGVFAGHHRVGHDHAVPLVHAEASPAFDLGGQMGAGRACEQASHLLVVFSIASRSVVDHAAATGHAGLAAPQGGG